VSLLATYDAYASVVSLLAACLVNRFEQQAIEVMGLWSKVRRTMPRNNADFAWYSEESRKRKLPPRCPIASSDLCPRYYQSIALLGNAGVTTTVPEDRVVLLDRKWKPFEPIIDEESPSYSKVGDKLLSISHFCPEVTYEMFGYFGSGLYGYGDEIDRGVAQKAYEREGIPERFDPAWASMTPRHYTECREYSIHANFAVGKLSKGISIRKGLSPQIRWQVLARDSFTCTYCGRRPPDVVLEVDHRVSVKDGGSNDPENLVAACSACNGGKGAFSLRPKS